MVNVPVFSIAFSFALSYRAGSHQVITSLTYRNISSYEHIIIHVISLMCNLGSSVNLTQMFMNNLYMRAYRKVGSCSVNTDGNLLYTLLWIQGANICFICRVVGLILREGARSSDIQEELKVEPMLLNIERNQMRWSRHLVRMPPEHLPE